jgi:hypothetical protein
MSNQEKRELIEGNVMMSKYLYGSGTTELYYQVGYRNTSPVYRRADELCDDVWTNFHNNWDLLMDVVCRIAKDDPDAFTNEDILQTEIKNNMFEFAYDPKITWYSCLKYVKLKLAI